MSHLEMSLTVTQLQSDTLKQKCKVNEWKAIYSKSQKASYKGRLSAAEILEALRAERRILFYMECADSTLLEYGKHNLVIKV